MKFCKCGCGQITKMITKTSSKDGRIKGEYNDYIHNHHFKFFREPTDAKRLRLKLHNPMHSLSDEKKEEWRIKNSIAKKGKIPWNPKGSKRPDMMGSKHPNWKDGRTSLWHRIRNLPESHSWRNSVFLRDNYRCSECGYKGKLIHAHHVNPFASILEDFLNTYKQFSVIDDVNTLVRLSLSYHDFWDTSNGKTLCKPCHINKHKGEINFSPSKEER
jgi:hypothetical protein